MSNRAENILAIAVVLIAGGGFAIAVHHGLSKMAARDVERTACMAANPGYECVEGFVRGGAFAPPIPTKESDK